MPILLMMNNKSAAKLVNIRDIRKAIKIKGPIGNLIAACAMRILGFSRINALYPQYSMYSGRDFTDAAMKTYRIRCDINSGMLESIPQKGPFIIVSNHPFGGWDGIVLYNTIASVRPDFKIMANFILSLIPNLKGCFFEVNPFTDNKKLKNSFGGLRQAYGHIRQGGCLGIFPAGEVATYYGKNSFPADKEWQPAIIKFIKKCNVPIVPVYFDGSNSRLFHLLGKINPYLRTAALPRELDRKASGTVTMRIGKLISTYELSEYGDTDAFGKYLRNRCYALEANTPGHASVKKADPAYEELILPQNRILLRNEIRNLEKSSILFEAAKYECLLADPENIPCLLKEIGRKREESFREVGEGTGKSIDTDKFDPYYKHLILWDKQKRKLVGAYRLGIGREIMAGYGTDGFYTSTLFSFSDGFKEKLPEAIELGRSFISVEYKKEALPLMLLIKGLLYSVIKYSDCKYLFGPASISSWYPPFYRSLMVYVLSMYKKEGTEYSVIPKTPFVPDYLRVEPCALFPDRPGNIEKFDRFMLNLSEGRYRLPTLLKKYIRLNSEILAFNIDTEFNDCVDGMIFLRLKDVPMEEIAALVKGSEDPEAIYRRFGYGTGS